MASRYSKLTYMSFEKTLKPYCKGMVEVENNEGIFVRKNITAQYLDSKILLVSGLDEDDVTRFEEGDGVRSAGIGKDVLSAFRNGKPLFEWIVAAYSGKDRKELEDTVSLHFESELLPLLQGRRAQDAKRAIWQIAQVDKDIPQDELAKLKTSYNQDDAHLFLAKSFIYAVIRDSLVGNEYPTNAAVEQVLSDIEATGHSTLLNGLIDSIYECAVEGLDIFDRMPYYESDIIKFVLGVLPVIDDLDKKYRDKFNEIRTRALQYEMNGEFMAGISSACNTLFKKYGIGERDFKLTQISWSDKAATLDLHFVSKVKNPFFIWRAEDMAGVRTAEEFGKVLGISVEEFEKYGFNPNDAYFTETQDEQDEKK